MAKGRKFVDLHEDTYLLTNDDHDKHTEKFAEAQK